MPRATETIREARISQGLTQVQLACRAGVASRTVQMVEAGREVSWRTIRQLALTLGIDPEQAAQSDCLDNAIDSRVCSPDANSSVPVDDGFLELPWSISQFLKNRFFPTIGSLCRNEAEVCEVVRLLRENFREQIVRQGDPDEKARFLEIDDRLDAAYFRYEQHYIDLWHEVPEAIQVDRINDSFAGVSIVIPLKRVAYVALMRGERSFVDLRSGDFQPQSQYVLLDSATEFPVAASRPWYQLTRSLSFIMFSQIAALSEAPSRDDFAMASFSASRTNLKRLMAIGFELAGTRMHEFNYDMCRFGGDDESGELDVEVQRSAMAYFSHLTKRISPTAMKTSSVKRMLAMIKRQQVSRTTKDRQLQNAG